MSEELKEKAKDQEVKGQGEVGGEGAAETTAETTADGRGRSPSAPTAETTADGRGRSPSAPSDEVGGEGAAETTVETTAETTADGRGRSPSAPSAEAKPAEPDWKDHYARLLADFDNYKKRAARDREDSYRFAESDILKDILPTVDNLALALASVAGASPSDVDAESLPRQNKEEPSANEDPFVKGVQLVYDSLLKSFKDHGAEPFDSLGKELDPNTMEAIAHLPSPDIAEGKVSNEVKRGWMLKGKLLRAAQVVVSSGLPPKA